MTASLVTAIQTFAKEHSIPLQEPDISLHVGDIRPDDYDALYAGVARLLPHVPEALHVGLYEVASHAFTAIEEFDSLREACDRYLIRDSSVHVDASGEIVKVDDNKPSTSISHVSDCEPLQEINEDYDNEYEELEDYGHDASADGPYPIDTLDATLGKIPGESSSRWKLSDNDAFTRPKSCHRSLLYHAGYFPFERTFGVPYFATEAPADSHRYFDDAPTNADVQRNAKNNAVDRGTLVEAHRPWRRRWTTRESTLLRELVANRAGGTRGVDKFADSEKCKKTAKEWSIEVWDSLAVQAGKRLSGRPGHALMCRYFNADDDAWASGEDAFLREANVVDACLRDPDGGWDVIGAAVKRPGMACLRRWQEIHTKRKSVWSYADDARLRKAVSAVGKQWSAVSLIMGDRTGPQCMHRYVKQLTGKRAGRWSLEEIRRLREAVADGNDWIEIARRVGTRNDVQCREKWVCGLDPDVKHGPWDKDEDEVLKDAVENSRDGAWSHISEKVPGRTDVQCRRRWMLLEQEGIGESNEKEKKPVRQGQKVGRWSREELGRLRDAVKEFGFAWEKIAERVGSRQLVQCREKWEGLSKTGLINAGTTTQAGNKAARWSKEETRLLNEAVQKVGKAWRQVSIMVSSRDDVQCREKWLSLQGSPSEPGWKRADDDLLRFSAKKDDIDWKALSEKLERSKEACQQRLEVLQQRDRKRKADATSEPGADVAVKKRKQGRWSIEETRLLTEGLSAHGRDFAALANMVKTRNEIQCREKWQAVMNAAAIDATWTDAEDHALTKAIEQNGPAWETIAESVPGRSVPQCRRRWKMLRERGRKGRLGRWKGDEIARLKTAIKEVGKDWARVATRVGSRNDWQCREKWGSGWEEDDDRRLREAVKEIGLKWKEVRKLMPGFSEAMCRKRWKELEGQNIGGKGDEDKDVNVKAEPNAKEKELEIDVKISEGKDDL